MYEKKKRRRGYIALEALDPHDRGTWDVLISHERMDYVANLGKAQAYEAAYIVPQALHAPHAIFSGLRWDEDEARDGMGWLCYVHTPSLAFNQDGSRRPP